MASTVNRDGRPSREDLAAAVDKVLPDVIAPGLDVLLCGINPGLWSAATGHHFARPGNRFWPALHRGGFTPRQLRPDEQELLIGYGLGITNLAARATARADELTRDELTAGGAVLREKVARFAPAWLAVLGVTAFRTAFGAQRVTVGPQDGEFSGARLWILPNPSGLNAHFTLDALAAEFAALRRAVAYGADPSSPGPSNLAARSRSS
ncbi:G/U mismatch-specific DNA glycosylase [Dactylosporangium aurantiacum]|uniref:G/U mismatch-specific DNA glycosylase n=1 Tax=Dactylosporangium aurantiacum TaxID=35754 RepID=A0A9Q9ILP4_9ACTN|nr:G/U mismatch-specific DNA glycosylase [Dactylosporangium aurantiacum]MDG6109730.1 G/U mismatch-specific DNA glycosylase [Dactylosporangium aurantiacum]UWZ56330.1 G/U mismatch-specific DNA glycosylase [Dactylosporangium aurantiacum]